MITSRRDYILRIIDEVGLLLARVVFQRGQGRAEDALQSVVMACERLFGQEAHWLFQFTPDQHFVMLTQGEAPADARDKLLLYATLNREAAACYLALGNMAVAQASHMNALRFTLRAHYTYGAEGNPGCTPVVPELLDALKGVEFDDDLQELLRNCGYG